MAVTATTLKREGSLKKLFSDKITRLIMGYMATYNMEDQILAIDATPADIQVTGTGSKMVNGMPIANIADAALDISTDTEGVSITKWATATAYTINNIRLNRDGDRFRCILAHTSSADDQPGYGINWEVNWEVSHHEAVNATGSVISATGYSRWFMVTVKNDGQATVWLAGDEALDGYEELKVPVYDPKEYCVVGFIHINASSEHTMGTTTLATVGTFFQHMGFCFPSEEDLAAIK